MCCWRQILDREGNHSEARPASGRFVVMNSRGLTEQDWVAGIVTEATPADGEIELLVYLPNEGSQAVWLPAWSKDGDVGSLQNGSKVSRQSKKPVGEKAMKHRAAVADVMLTGDITTTGRLAPDTLRDMRARGILGWTEQPSGSSAGANVRP